MNKQIAFYITYDPNWLGGFYYKKYLITALLDDNQRNKILIYTDEFSKSKITDEFKDLSVELRNIEISIPKGFGKIEILFRRFFGFSLWTFLKLRIKNIIVFDYKPIGVLRNVKMSNRIYWIPDLQDRYLPQLFSKNELSKKNNRYKYLSKNANHIVFSSRDSCNSFLEFYPLANRKGLQLSILNFAVFHKSTTVSNLSEVLKKYNIEKDKYFIISNQFMAHKNHKIIFDAIRYILSTSEILKFKIILTGNKYDPRNINYFKSLIDECFDDLLNDYIIFTGEIDREEQLYLLDNAVAVIQPSKFEGWNSTVEDVKCMNLNIICSGINVHFEQLADYPNVVFFDINSSVNLAKIMMDFYTNIKVPSEYNYQENQNKFKKDLLALFK